MSATGDDDFDAWLNAAGALPKGSQPVSEYSCLKNPNGNYHSWKFYKGFNEEYDFCEYCDKKVRPDDNNI